MTSVAVVVGHSRNDDAHRLANRAWVVARYQAHDYPVAVGAAASTPWVKAHAFNPTAATLDADVLVIDIPAFFDFIQRVVIGAQHFRAETLVTPVGFAAIRDAVVLAGASDPGNVFGFILGRKMERDRITRCRVF